MNKNDFLEDLEDLLQREEPCDALDVLETYEEWDSLSQMSLIAYFGQKFNVKLGLEDFQKLNTISDLMNLAGEQISD